jgi:LacI family transcriptional regulator
VAFLNIKEVANRAGVSVATISRVLNHPESVAPATRKRIEAVMESLDYTPNWFARGLKLNRTGTIALMVPEILDQGYMEIAKGVEDVARQKDQNIILATTEEDRNRELKTIESFIERKIDGLIIVSSVLTKKDLAQFRNQKMPVVFIGKNPELTGVNGVLTNYSEAAAEAVNHLIEIGHRRIAMIQGSRPFNENREKSEGYHQAMEKAGLDHSEDWVVEEENTIEGGFLAMSKLFSEGRKPEAVFVTSDYMAIGAMDKIKQMGMRVPEDIAIIGFDNLRISGYVEPKLTTVAKPMYRMGLVAARLLMDTIEEDRPDAEPQEILIQSKLKIRKSCGHEDRFSEIF